MPVLRGSVDSYNAAPNRCIAPKKCHAVRCAHSSKCSRLYRQSPQYKAASPMALKPPPPPWELLQQVSELVSGSVVKGEVDKSMRSLAQSALSRLDMVSREEFDTQTEILQRTRARVVALEAALEELTGKLDTLTRES